MLNVLSLLLLFSSSISAEGRLGCRGGIYNSCLACEVRLGVGHKSIRESAAATAVDGDEELSNPLLSFILLMWWVLYNGSWSRTGWRELCEGNGISVPLILDGSLTVNSEFVKLVRFVASLLSLLLLLILFITSCRYRSGWSRVSYRF